MNAVALFRPSSIIQLPKRSDEVHLLDFSQEERDIYESTKLRTKQILQEGENDSSQPLVYLNCLQWLNKLRLICNHGTFKPRQEGEVHDFAHGSAILPSNTTAAQATFSSMLSAGVAMCFGCSHNLVEEPEYHNFPENFSPRLSQCMALLCGSCVSKKSAISKRSACHHTPTCPTFDVALNPPARRSEQSRSVLPSMTPEQRPIKLRTLLRGLETSRWGEKR